jgi:hypothetical protein
MRVFVMEKVVDKTLLYNPETLQALETMREKAGDKHFDAWDFGVAVSSIAGVGRRANPAYLGRMAFSKVTSPDLLWMVRMREVVSVGAALIAQKVLADVLHGAEHNKAWKDWVKVAEMDEPKDQVPTISEDDFLILEGTAGAKGRYAGGKFGSVALDCSEDRGLHKVILGIKKTWIKDNKWNSIQEATTVAGAAAYKHVATDIATKLLASIGGTEAFDTDLYKTIVKAIATNRKAGFNPDAVLVNPDQEATLMAMDKFISIEMLGRVGRLAEEGVIGNFYGTIPVYSTSVCGANPLVYTRAKGVVAGLRQDIQIEDYDDPIQSLEGAVLTMRFDLAAAFSAAIRKVNTA